MPIYTLQYVRVIPFLIQYDTVCGERKADSSASAQTESGEEGGDSPIPKHVSIFHFLTNATFLCWFSLLFLEGRNLKVLITCLTE